MSERCCPTYGYGQICDCQEEKRQAVIDAARAWVALGICHDECESHADRKLIDAVRALDGETE